MPIPYYTRGDKSLREASDMPGIIAEFEAERDRLDVAFTAVAAGVAAAVVPATNDWVTPPTGTVVGQSCFDTTATEPFWWDGTQWVDATGTPHA
jgi:hypothetical protein